MYGILDSVRSTATHDGIVVLDIQGGRIFHLNTTASRVFQCVQEGWTQLQIVQAISEEYNIPFDTAKKDICEFLESMKKAGILHNDHRR